MSRFKDLKVWQESKHLAVTIYRLTERGKFRPDFGFRDQIRRAAISVSSNIAEGDELNTNLQSIRHFYIAKGSSAEILSQAIIAFEIGYLDKDSFQEIEAACLAISKMLMKLIQARRLQKPRGEGI
jgi:four helix bundle protein